MLKLTIKLDPENCQSHRQLASWLLQLPNKRHIELEELAYAIWLTNRYGYPPLNEE